MPINVKNSLNVVKLHEYIFVHKLHFLSDVKDINNLASKSQYDINIVRRIDLSLFHTHLKHNHILVSFKQFSTRETIFLVIGIENEKQLTLDRYDIAQPLRWKVLGATN